MDVDTLYEMLGKMKEEGRGTDEVNIPCANPNEYYSPFIVQPSIDFDNVVIVE